MRIATVREDLPCGKRGQGGIIPAIYSLKCTMLSQIRIIPGLPFSKMLILQGKKSGIQLAFIKTRIT
jgi:hypothetical protein